MQNDKLFLLLRVVRKSDLKEFERFVRGFYPGQRKLHRIIAHLAQFHPLYDSPKVEKPVVIKKLFGKEKTISEKSLSNYYQRIYKYLEEYLAWKELQQSPFEKNCMLLGAFNKLQSEKLFFDLIENTERNLRDRTENDGEDLFYFFRLLLLRYFKYFSSISDKRISKPLSADLEEGILFLEKFYVFMRMRFSCELLSRQNILQEGSSATSLKRPFAVPPESYRHEPFFQLFSKMQELIKDKKKEEFLALKDQLAKGLQGIGKSEQSVILSYLLNHTADCIKKGKLEFIQTAFELYEIGMKHDILISNNYLSSTQFTNIINVAAYLKEFEWLDEFVKNHQQYLRSADQENLIRLTEAQLHFEKAAYGDVIKLLRTVHFENAYFKIRGRALILRSYVEDQEEVNLILDYCRSFKEQLRRDKTFNEKILKSYVNFVELTAALMRTGDKKTLLKRIQDTEYLQYRDWLFSKANTPSSSGRGK